jgi:hypothetical protein
MLCAAAAATTMLALAGPAGAGTIYNVNFTIAMNSPEDHSGFGYVSGTLTTNGQLGQLALSDILSWDFNVSAEGHDATFSNLDSRFRDYPGHPGASGLTATASDLFFDFSQQGGFELDETMPSFPNNFIILSFSGDPVEGVADIEVPEIQNDLSWVAVLWLMPPSNVETRIATEGRYVATTPLPGGLPFFATGLGGLALLAMRRRGIAAPRLG